jgi:23S rRNA pseudouridine1911/1915/1917 synthase
VHRLDTGTSGVLLAARTAEAYRALRAQFRTHAVTKEYLAVVAGRLERAVRIDAPIGQHRGSVRRVRAIASPEAARRYAPRPACTDAAPEQVFADATLVRARTKTGARHQIRVHLASIGHPLLGDPLYGAETVSPADDGFLLHASRIEWTDPATGAPTYDVAAPPVAWQQHLERLAAARARRNRR